MKNRQVRDWGYVLDALGIYKHETDHAAGTKRLTIMDGVELFGDRVHSKSCNFCVNGVYFWGPHPPELDALLPEWIELANAHLARLKAESEAKEAADRASRESARKWLRTKLNLS